MRGFNRLRFFLRYLLNHKKKECLNVILKDIYKGVTIELPDIATIKFIFYANEAVSELKNRYSGIEQEEMTELEQDLTISKRFKTAIIKYILAQSVTDGNLHGKYMSEFYNSSENAYDMFKKETRGMVIIAVPPFR